MAVTIMFGLAFATLLTLVVVPLLYAALFRDLRSFAGGVYANRWTGATGGPCVTPGAALEVACEAHGDPVDHLLGRVPGTEGHGGVDAGPGAVGDEGDAHVVGQALAELAGDGHRAGEDALGTDHVDHGERRQHHRHLPLARRLGVEDAELDAQHVGSRGIHEFEGARELRAKPRVHVGGNLAGARILGRCTPVSSWIRISVGSSSTLRYRSGRGWPG
jgi:hypothetical protein